MGKDKTTEFIEKGARSLVFRLLVYGLPLAYVLRLVDMIMSPQAEVSSWWPDILLQALRDSSTVAFVFLCRRYLANYSSRRASLLLRRRDAWQLPLLGCFFLGLRLPQILDGPWFLGFLILVPLCGISYFWEMHQIRRLEVATPKHNPSL